jgi:hypothetical protein
MGEGGVYFVEPINQNFAHFAYRFFPAQAKFAYWSKNPDYATESGPNFTYMKKGLYRQTCDIDISRWR